MPRGERPTRAARRRRKKTERGASSGPRRILVGLVAVAVGTLSVVTVRAVVGGGTTPVAGQPAEPAPATNVPDAPTISATAPEVPETAVAVTPTTTPTATTVPVLPPATSAAPAVGATQFSGSGNFVIDATGYDLTRKLMVITHNGVAEFQVSTLDQDLIQLALVESAVGAVSGTYPLGFDGVATPRYIRVDADGEWAIEIKPVEEARLWQADFIAGTGADVLRYEGGASVLDYTNAGSSNFIVQYYRNPGFDLLVNEIGPISGTTIMQAGPGVVVVDAEADWALSAKPT